jgi:single-strand DNA-binding protein
MAKGLNRVTLLGNLGKDPELKTTGGGASVANFSVATPDSYKDKNGEWQESTDWHNIVVWNRQAEVAAQYLKKGSKVLIEGKIKTRSYEGRDGVTRYITEVVCTNLVLLSGGGGGGGQSYSPAKDYSDQTPASEPQNNAGSSYDDDDIPF